MKATLEDIKLECWLRMRDVGVIVWKTKDGKVIPIKELTSKHLVNIVNLFTKSAEESDEQEMLENSDILDKDYCDASDL